MSKRGPLITLACVVVLAVIFLWANTLVAKPGSTAAAVPAASASTAAVAPSTTAAAPLHALYAGRSSGDQVTLAIAINGRKAAADLNAGQASEVSLQGSVSGSKVTLTSQNGTGVTASVVGADMFGTVTGFLGQSFPFAAAQAAVEAVYTGRSSGNQVTLAVETDGAKAAAYVCNGKTIEAWLQGSVNGNQISLAGNKGASLTGSLSGLDLFGTVTAGAGRASRSRPNCPRTRPGSTRPGSRSTGWPPGSAGRYCPTGPRSGWPWRARPNTPRRRLTWPTEASP